MFLFHSTRTTNQICTSFNRVVLLLLLVLFIFCCTVPRLTNAYPMSTQFNNHRENFQQINDENSLQRNQRGTGYHILNIILRKIYDSILAVDIRTNERERERGEEKTNTQNNKCQRYLSIFFFFLLITYMLIISSN